MLHEIIYSVVGGAGGSGSTSFHRERYVPRGGPDGGDGGMGGAVILEASSSVQTLDRVSKSKKIRGGDGEGGGSGRRRGRNGVDTILVVPVGTVVWRLSGSWKLVADMSTDGTRLVAARGGEGGRGNAGMATSVRKAPRIAEKGLPGERARIRLELRLAVDIAIVDTRTQLAHKKETFPSKADP